MMLPDFAVLGVDPVTRRLLLRSRHDNSGHAFSAYRAASSPVMLVRFARVRLQNAAAVVAAKGADAEELQQAEDFCTAVLDMLWSG